MQIKIISNGKTLKQEENERSFTFEAMIIPNDRRIAWSIQGADKPIFKDLQPEDGTRKCRVELSKPASTDWKKNTFFSIVAKDEEIDGYGDVKVITCIKFKRDGVFVPGNGQIKATLNIDNDYDAVEVEDSTNEIVPSFTETSAIKERKINYTYERQDDQCIGNYVLDARIVFNGSLVNEGEYVGRIHDADTINASLVGALVDNDVVNIQDNNQGVNTNGAPITIDFSVAGSFGKDGPSGTISGGVSLTLIPAANYFNAKAPRGNYYIKKEGEHQPNIVIKETKHISLLSGVGLMQRNDDDWKLKAKAKLQATYKVNAEDVVIFSPEF